MKTATLFSLAASAALTNAVKFVSGPEGWPEAIGFKTTNAEDHGDMFLPPKIKARQSISRKVEMKTRNPHIPNSKTVKIRYGPYTVPGGKVYVLEALVQMMSTKTDYATVQVAKVWLLTDQILLSISHAAPATFSE